MECFDTSRGIGRELELFGIRSSYILLFAAGIAIGILFYFILSVSGVSVTVSIAVAVVWCTLSAVGTFQANRVYGEKGLIKKIARRGIPRGIRVGVRSYNLIRHKNAKQI